jgi:hypothetical protein
MVVATCRLKPKYKYSLHIEETLLTLWQEQVAYRYFKAQHIRRDGQQITLRYVTLSGNTSADLCVTGTIIVSSIGVS